MFRQFQNLRFCKIVEDPRFCKFAVRIQNREYDATFVPIYFFEFMFFTYILQSEVDSSYYIGSCENIRNRLEQHNGGLVKSTKRYLPWILAYKEKFETLVQARKREAQIKSWKKRVAIERLIQKNKS